jgi:hypothetical protein
MIAKLVENEKIIKWDLFVNFIWITLIEPSLKPTATYLLSYETSMDLPLR